jgi:PPE-repeat protein
MYSGPGSGSMMAAVSAWLAVASQLDSAARGYNAVIAGLQGQAWSGVEHVNPSQKITGKTP